MSDAAVVSITNKSDPVEVYLGKLDSPASQATMRTCLTNLRAMAGRPLYTLDWEEMVALRAALVERFPAPASVNKHLSALRGVVIAARQLGLAPLEAELRVRDLKNAKGKRLPAGRALEEHEIGAMVAQCNPADITGARDGALLAVLCAGLRREEAVDLNFEDFDFAGETLRVLGKGDKERLVPLPAGGSRMIAAWLVYRGLEPGPLFTPTYRDPPAIERLTVNTVYDRVRALAERAALAKTTPHDMRRTTATLLLDKDVDIGTVADILGHASTDTTRIYARRKAQRAQEAMSRLDLGGQHGQSE